MPFVKCENRQVLSFEMTANVLVIGSGGREHALCWKLDQSPDVKEIYVVPGNVGIQQITKVKIVDINIKDYKAVSKWCQQNNVGLVVVGPEDPLAGGIANELLSAGIPCFGPSREASRIESDKSWAKEFMKRHEIPTAQWGAFSDAQEAKKFIKSATFPALVVKASGLAAGKGVVVAKSQEHACQTVDNMLNDRCFGDAGNKIVVEELLIGEEVSVLAFSDGNTVRAMLPSQDHKRLKNNDEGPNTGGMGAYCPCPLISAKELQMVEEKVLQRAVDGLRKENTPFVGVLYAGLMLTNDGPKVLEFNCRFGDPETQVILPLLDSDLYQVMRACCSNLLANVNLKWKREFYAVGVVMASQKYPESSTKGKVITGIEEAMQIPNNLVFHSGTAQNASGEIVTNGGRVLISVALAHDLTVAAARARKMCVSTIKFDGAQYRTDIAHKGIARSLLQKGLLTYKESGVDINAGDSLVNQIKSYVKKTNRTGVLGSIGGFGGVFDVPATGYSDPLLVSGTDGVGTKLKVAQQCGIHSTVGIDLVAMCVNDILAQGAEPLFFLDYFATGNLNVDVASQVVSGVAEGCRLANCALIGGETAEMPGLYAEGDYDLAGFAVGAVERKKLLPVMDSIIPGDIVLGLSSSGIHSNGFSLVRKVVERFGVKYSSKAPFSKTGKSYGEEFLTPTKIYVKGLLKVLQSGKVKALAHITGGGLIENIPRVLPDGTGVRLDAASWEIPPVFGWIAAAGGVSETEMLRTFNCGIGVVLIVNPNDVADVQKLITEEDAKVIGQVEKLSSTGVPRVHVENFVPEMERIMRPFVESVVAAKEPPRKRVGVLISGSGTNLQSLIDATVDRSQGVGAEIVIVISNKAGVQGLERATRANIHTKVIPHTAYGSRLEFDMAVHAALKEARVDIVCLAGFMRVLTGDFVRLWRGRLINIHPALLPLFKGTHAHRQALQAGVRVTGCTAHFVEEDIDAGAILAQEAVQIEIDDTEETLQERVKLVEHKVFPKALKLVATEQVHLDENGKIVWKH
ncbi:trifunctional purine biosynthetic protein adenosine-3 isoform X2 [Schistocerca piceifrons]|uniref:trifunctional purine biosynthetic protein adenosine-3 isoform X2 n=1 Tax=Schistocerca piceifrons TaxID=274613 RepID=UPI001F5F41D8|nr:trifunctional purine biosynthetic protein adenosine-3 isoform X2 [Schistocerca piceifrons]